MATWVLGEFAAPAELLAAARALRERGVPGLDAHTPYPVHGLDEAMGLRRSPVPLFAFFGGVGGVLTAYSFQYYTAAVSFPLNVGNRPAHAPLAFIPITFELMVLFAAFSIFFGLLVLWRLPRPHHPLFEVEAFASASTHGFWVTAELTDDSQVEQVTQTLRSLGARSVNVHPEAMR